MKKYRIFTHKFHDTGEYLILSEESIERKPLCECYGSYGQLTGCHGAGCYSINNSDSTFKSDLNEYISKKFDINFDYDWDYDCYGLDYLDTFKRIKEEVDKWISENTNHTEAEAYTYWDGCNYRSIILHSYELDDSLIEWEEEEDLVVVDPCVRLGEGIVDHYKLLKNAKTGEEFEVSITRYASDYTYS